MVVSGCVCVYRRYILLGAYYLRLISDFQAAMTIMPERYICYLLRRRHWSMKVGRRGESVLKKENGAKASSLKFNLNWRCGKLEKLEKEAAVKLSWRQEETWFYRDPDIRQLKGKRRRRKVTMTAIAEYSQGQDLRKSHRIWHWWVLSEPHREAVERELTIRNQGVGWQEEYWGVGFLCVHPKDMFRF